MGLGLTKAAGCTLLLIFVLLPCPPPLAAILVLPQQWYGVSLFSCQDARPPAPRKQLKDVVGDKLSTETTLSWSLHTGAPLLLPAYPILPGHWLKVNSRGDPEDQSHPSVPAHLEDPHGGLHECRHGNHMDGEWNLSGVPCRLASWPQSLACSLPGKEPPSHVYAGSG